MSFKRPTEIIELPSKGLIYPKENPLSSGTIEIKYGSSEQEDILTNANLIHNGTVYDELLKSLIVSPVNFNDLILGDKSGIFVAARILMYTKNYAMSDVIDPKTGVRRLKPYIVDLTEIKDKELHEVIKNCNGVNDFPFTLPKTGNEITFKLLTVGDDAKINKELEGLKKISLTKNYDVSTRMKFVITSVNGARDTKTIREFVDSGALLSQDTLELRKYITKITPGVILAVPYKDDEGSVVEGATVQVKLDLSFFWPSTSEQATDI